MHTTLELIDLCKEKLGIKSDYALSNALNATRSSVSRYRKGHDTLGDRSSIRVAEILGLSFEYVMACAHAERANNEVTRSAFADLAHRSAPGAAKYGRRSTDATPSAGQTLIV